jgi:hypothetical protein
MKTVLITATLFLTFVISLSAQQARPGRDLTKEEFNIKLSCTKGKTCKVLSFTSAEGVAYKPKIIDAGALNELNIPARAILSGTFRFESFASDGGLGGTRVQKGKGYGKLQLSDAVDARGVKLGCPPLCERVIDLGLAF